MIYVQVFFAGDTILISNNLMLISEDDDEMRIITEYIESQYTVAFGLNFHVLFVNNMNTIWIMSDDGNIEGFYNLVNEASKRKNYVGYDDCIIYKLEEIRCPLSFLKEEYLFHDLIDLKIPK